MKKLKLKIVTQERVVAEDEAARVTLPIEGGEITVLPDHIPYIGKLKAGEITVFRDKSRNESSGLAVSGGFVEFHDNVLTILADTAEHAHEIDAERAQAAIDRAKALMEETTRESAEEYAKVAAALEKQLTRLRVARKHHTKHGFSGSDSFVGM